MDASVSLVWIFKDHKLEPDLLLENVQIDEAIVPLTWLREMANGIAVGERRGRLTREAADVWRDALLEIESSIAIDPGPERSIFLETFDLARLYSISIYDAAYLELAIRETLALATLDTRLRTAAEAAGIEVLP